MTVAERKEVVYSKALSIVQYGLALYSGQTEEIKDRLTTIMMRGNKAIHGQPILKDTKNETICRRIGVKTPRQLIVEASVKASHTVINTQKPPEIFKMLIFP